MDLLDRIKCIERLVDMDRKNAIDALVGIIIDANISLQGSLDTYGFLYDLDESAAVAAMAHVATDRTRSGYSRAVAGSVLYRDARPEGLRAFRELSADPDVPGFYRVYHFAEFGGLGTRASRLLELSRDTTLPAEWRIFAAEELWEGDHGTGIDALRAIQQDASVGRWMGAKLAARIFAYERLADRPGLLSRWWISAMKLIGAENLLCEGNAGPQFLRSYLLPHERQINLRRSHPAALLAPLGLLLCGTIVATVLSAVFPQGLALAIIWSAWTLLPLNLIRSAGAWSVSYILLTSYRLLATRGFVFRKVNMMPMGRGGTDMYFERSLFGRIFGYGTFNFNTFNFKVTTILLQVKHTPYPGLLYRDMLSMILLRKGEPLTPQDQD
jgi:hypothetical protein